MPTKKSTGFAGYDLNTKFSGPSVNQNVTATITVPKLKCTKTNTAIGVNAGLFEDSRGNPSSGGLFVGCVKGKARYYPFLTINGHKTTYPGTVAHVGDEVTVEADVNSTETVAEVFDHTHFFDKSKTGAPYSSFVGVAVDRGQAVEDDARRGGGAQLRQDHFFHRDDERRPVRGSAAPPALQPLHGQHAADFDRQFRGQRNDVQHGLQAPVTA